MTPDQQNRSRVYIVLVNWNGWADTLECLESLLHSDYPDFRVVVCDNGSTDGSLDAIKSWAQGGLIPDEPRSVMLRALSVPPIAKPLAYVEYSRREAEEGGNGADYPLTIVRIDENLGFAGGNNVGIRFALSRDDFAFVWLLNNDTLVTPQTLSALTRRMAEKPRAGLCGSKLLFYQQPQVVQGLGGASYNKWLGTNRHLGYLSQADNLPVQVDVEAAMDYVIGASMLVSKRFLLEIGLMAEEYFLYFEELDWAYRAHGRFSLAYAAESIVYHKEGSSAGSCDPARKSWSVDFFTIRSKLLFTWKFFPVSLPTVYAGLLCALCNRIRRGQWDRVRMIIELACSSRSRLLALKQ